jgi:N-acetylglucosaminyl-diphospho-decaprenol L-rhamnosyltransferase
MNEAPRKLSVGCAVVTHNSARHVTGLLRSLAPLSLEALVLVDNDSTDDTLEAAERETLPFATVAVQRPNHGYAAGANAAVRELRRIGIDLLLLLNPDTVVEAADLDAVSGLFEDDARLGSLCPVLVKADGRTFDSLGLRLTPWASVADHAQGQRRYATSTRVEPAVIGPTGAGGVYRMSALETLDGPFDERFFMYFEDADLALRLRRDSWRTVTSDLITVVHGRGGLGGLRGSAATQAECRALEHRQRSYELFVATSPISPGRRLLGRLAARLRRQLVSRRLIQLEELSFE